METSLRFTIDALELPVRLHMERPFSDEELLRFCARNELLRIEREPDGDLSVMSPSGAEAGILMRNWHAS